MNKDKNNLNQFKVIDQKRSDLLEKEKELMNGVFNTPQGRELMKLWKKKYIYERPVAAWENPMAYAYHTEGQNSFIRHIIHNSGVKDE